MRATALLTAISTEIRTARPLRRWARSAGVCSAVVASARHTAARQFISANAQRRITPMITTRSHSQRPHALEFYRRLAPAFSAVTAVLMSAALVCSVAAEQQGVAPRYDRRVLSDIAR